MCYDVHLVDLTTEEKEHFLQKENLVSFLPLPISSVSSKKDPVAANGSL